MVSNLSGVLLKNSNKQLFGDISIQLQELVIEEKTLFSNSLVTLLKYSSSADVHISLSEVLVKAFWKKQKICVWLALSMDFFPFRLQLLIILCLWYTAGFLTKFFRPGLH